MNSKFRGFVVATLAAELIIAELYQLIPASSLMAITFYTAMGYISLLRAKWVMKNIKPSLSAVSFCVIMISTIFATIAMALITGLTSIAITYKWFVLIDNGLASTYYFMYTCYPYVAVALTVMELLSLLLKQTGYGQSGMGYIIYNSVSGLFAYQNGMANTGAKKIQ